MVSYLTTITENKNKIIYLWIPLIWAVVLSLEYWQGVTKAGSFEQTTVSHVLSITTFTMITSVAYYVHAKKAKTNMQVLTLGLAPFMSIGFFLLWNNIRGKSMTLSAGPGWLVLYAGIGALLFLGLVYNTLSPRRSFTISNFKRNDKALLSYTGILIILAGMVLGGLHPHHAFISLLMMLPVALSEPGFGPSIITAVFAAGAIQGLSHYGGLGSNFNFVTVRKTNQKTTTETMIMVLIAVFFMLFLIHEGLIHIKYNTGTWYILAALCAVFGATSMGIYELVKD